MDDEIFKNCQIPENLKLVDITPVFKKDDTNLAKNYRLVGVLLTLSKVFEKICRCNSRIMLILFYPHVCVVTEKGLVPNTLFYHY